MRRKIVQRFILQDDGTGTSATYGFQLDFTLPSVKALSALYQQVKISKIKIVVKPRYNMALGPIGQYTATYGTWEGNTPIIDGLIFSTTMEQTTQVINYNEALNAWSAKKHSQMGRGWKRVFTPRVIQQTSYINSTGPTFDTVTTGHKSFKAPYFNVNNPAAGTPYPLLPFHVGWWVVFPAATQGYQENIRYDVYVTLYTRWRHQYFNDDILVVPKEEE